MAAPSSDNWKSSTHQRLLVRRQQPQMSRAAKTGLNLTMKISCLVSLVCSSAWQATAFTSPQIHHVHGIRPSAGFSSKAAVIFSRAGLLTISTRSNIPLSAKNDNSREAKITGEDNESNSKNTESSSQPSSNAPFVGLPSYRRILLFVATTILIWVSEPLLSLVDSAAVGRYAGRTIQSTAATASAPNLSSVIQLAALGPATMLCDSSIYLTLFIAMATTNKLATAFAKNDVDEQITTLSHVMGVSLAVGTFLAAFIFFQGESMLSSIIGPAGATVMVETAKGGSNLVDLTPQVLRAALGYARIRSAIFPLAVMGLTSQAALLCAQDTLTPTLAVLVASLVNIVGDYIFVAKMGWGVRGAALATSMASLLANGMLVRKVWKTMCRWKTSEQEEIEENGKIDLTTKKIQQPEQKKKQPTSFISFPDRKSLISLLKLAGPMFFVLVGKTIGYSAMTIRAGNFGMVSLACHNVLMRVFFFFATFGDGLSHAAQTFLPGLLYQKTLQEEAIAEPEISQESSQPSTTISYIPETINDDNDNDARTLLKRLLLFSAVAGCVNSVTARFIANNAGRAFTTDSSLVSLMSHVR